MRRDLVARVLMGPVDDLIGRLWTDRRRVPRWGPRWLAAHWMGWGIDLCLPRSYLVLSWGCGAWRLYQSPDATPRSSYWLIGRYER